MKCCEGESYMDVIPIFCYFIHIWTYAQGCVRLDFFCNMCEPPRICVTKFVSYSSLGVDGMTCLFLVRIYEICTFIRTFVWGAWGNSLTFDTHQTEYYRMKESDGSNPLGNPCFHSHHSPSADTTYSVHIEILNCIQLFTTTSCQSV